MSITYCKQQTVRWNLDILILPVTCTSIDTNTQEEEEDMFQVIYTEIVIENNTRNHSHRKY